MPTVNQAFGNKLAVLGGDFLLSRASISLARLRNLEVTNALKLMSCITTLMNETVSFALAN